MKKRILFIVLIVLGLGTIGYFYINKIFLPVQLKQIVLKKARIVLKRDLSFSRVRYNPIKGVILENLIIYEKAPSSDTFIKIPEASFNVFLPSILKDQKIVIPYLTMKNPTVNITRYQYDTFNFSDIFTNIPGQRSSGRSQPFFLGGLSLDNAQVNYTDLTLKEDNAEAIQNINLKIGFSLKVGAKFSFSSRVPRYNSLIQAQGEYTLASKEFKGKVSLQNIPLSRFLQLGYKSDDLKFYQGQLQTGEFFIDQKENQWQVSGYLNIPGLDLSVKSTRLTGDLATDKLLVTLNNKNINATGNLNFKNALIALPQEREIRGNISAKNVEFNLLNNDISLTGDFGLDSSSIKIGPSKELTASIFTQQTVLKIKNQNIYLTAASAQINEADLKINNGIAFKGSINASDLNLNSEDKNISLNTRFQTANGDLTAQGKRLVGNPLVNLALQYQPQAVKPLQYSGTLEVSNAALSGLPKINSAENVTGKINFKDTGVSSENLKFTTLATPLEISGQVENFKNPKADIDFSIGKIDIAKITGLFPNLLSQYPIDLTGETQLKGTYNGSIQSPSAASVKLTAQFFNALLNLKKVDQTISQLNGEVDYSADIIEVKDLSGVFWDKRYTLNGKAIFVNHPQVDIAAVLSSSDVDISTKIVGSVNNYQISYLTGKFKNSSLDAKGKINVLENIVDLDLNGKASLELHDLAQFIPKEGVETFQKIKPEGELDLDFNLSGPTTRWRNWQVNASAGSEKISLYGYLFEKPSLKYTQRNRRMEELSLSSQIYDGRLLLNSSFDLNEENIIAQVTGDLDKLDLAKLRDSLELKNKDLSGTLSSSFTFSGPLKNHKKLIGEGKISILDGHLWRLHLIDGLMKALLVKEYQNVLFTDAACDFMIRNGKLQTDNLVIKGNTADLSGAGWINFDKSLSFLIKPRFKEDILFQNKSLQKAPSLVLSQTEYLAIKIMGTIDKPLYLPITDPTEIFKKATDILKEGVGDIFQEIF